MERLLHQCIVFFVLFIPGIAYAGGGTGVYAGGKVGMSVETADSRRVALHDFTDGSFELFPQTFRFGSGSDLVFAGGLVAGYDFSSRTDVPVRLELDYTGRGKGKVDSTRDITVKGSGGGTPQEIFETVKHTDRVTLQTLMVNAWVDIPTGTSVTPYLGGGLGWAFMEHKITHDVHLDNNYFTESSTSNKTNFAWSLGCGVGWNFHEQWTLDLGYRYIDAGEVATRHREDNGVTTTSKADVAAHDVMLGLRYAF